METPALCSGLRPAAVTLGFCQSSAVEILSSVCASPPLAHRSPCVIVLAMM